MFRCLNCVIYYTCIVWYIIFFFFSSRRRHTRLQGDWSSDVCSSDLPDLNGIDMGSVGPVFIQYTVTEADLQNLGPVPGAIPKKAKLKALPYRDVGERSEERRVGKECRSRWSPYH